MKLESLMGHADELVRIILKGAQPADTVVSEYMRQKKYLGANDRRIISAVVYHAVRTMACNEYLSDELQQPSISAIALSTALEGVFPFLLTEEMLGEQSANPEYWGAITALRAEIRRLEIPTDILCCMPAWIVELLSNRWDAATTYSVCNAMLAPASLCLRVNSLRTTVQHVLQQLHHENIQAAASPLAPEAIVVPGRVNLLQHPLFTGGFIEIQDHASQTIAHACAPEPWMVVLDACAGAGGKTLHLADVMKGKGLVIAQDVEWNRLKEIEPRARRAGLTNISIRHIGKKSGTPTHVSYEHGHVVLVDAPCSGMGTLRRMPMAKWKLTPELLQRHVQKQQNILQEYSERVLPEGALVYATCSILPQENEEVVHNFLENNSQFVFEAQQQYDPYHHNSDGLYWARMRRI
jgi:16S rRNA (cytosine967-C5)-methyltransferase